ncbi:MAG: hypothetical protein V9E87_17565 [Gemmatimonadales bacterium]
MFWNQIKRGERDGVLVFATQDAPLSVHRGLWMLPDPHTDFATIPAMPQVMLADGADRIAHAWSRQTRR